MVIALTGHTSGLGEAFRDELAQAGYQVVGFSRKSGYDISNPQDRKKIVEKIKDCDVFINNAFNLQGQDSSQLEMFFDVFFDWKEKKEKTIINISSRAPEYFELPNVTLKYGVYKAALDVASLQAEKQASRKCRIVNLKFGKIDTASIRHINGEKIDPKKAAQFLISILKSTANMQFTSLTLSP